MEGKWKREEELVKREMDEWEKDGVAGWLN